MKGESERQFTTSLPADHRDHRACPKVVFRVRETLLYVVETQKLLYCVQKIEGLFLGEKSPCGHAGGSS